RDATTTPRQRSRSRRNAQERRACRRWRSSTKPPSNPAIGDAAAALDSASFLHDPAPILPQPRERGKRGTLDGQRSSNDDKIARKLEGRVAQSEIDPFVLQSQQKTVFHTVHVDHG